MNGDDAILDHLDQVLRRVEQDVHVLGIPDADRLEQSRWYQSVRGTTQQMLREAAKAPLWSAPDPPPGEPHRQRVEVTSISDVVSARNLAYAPLEILVENSSSDGLFLTVLVEALGCESLVALWSGAPSVCTPPSCRIVQAGGDGQIPSQVNKLRDEARNAGRPARVVVIVDSDAEWPGHEPTDTITYRRLDDRPQISVHVLSKRNIECYLPNEFWEKWVASPDRTAARSSVAALLRLNSAQRDHVRLGKGAPWDSTKREASLLFVDVSDSDRQELTRDLKGKRDTTIILQLADPSLRPTAEEWRVRAGVTAQNLCELDVLINLLADML